MPTITATGQGDPKLLLGPVVQAAIDRVVATIPPDRRGKFELRITFEGVEAEAAIRLFQGVNAAAFWQRLRSGQQVGGARLRWVF